MSDYYSDEPLDWQSSDNPDYDGYGMPDGTDSIHSWDYFAPEDDDMPAPWETAASANEDESDLPLRIRQLTDMIRRQPWQITKAKSFYSQAKYMEDYADETDIVPFMAYFPTYQDMSATQLRSYFTIRAMLRHGKFPDVSLSYIFVYIYEILMQIGINNAGEGYEILLELQKGYSSDGQKLNRYLTPWLRDYVVYYNLSEHFSEVFKRENNSDSVAAVLSDYANADNKAFLEAVCSLSKYDIRKAALFAKQPAKTTDAAVTVLRTIIPRMESTNHHHFVTWCLGKKARRQVTMFYNAVFYNPEPIKEAVVKVSPRHGYYCHGGLWTKDIFLGDPANTRHILGAILHETDCQLRDLLGVKPRLKPKSSGVAYRQTVHDALAAWAKRDREEEARREAERRRITIDFSKLQRIRSDADVVQEKLLDGIEDTGTDGQEAERQEAVPQPQRKEKAEHSVQPTTSEPKETTFLRIFISGGDWRKYLRDIHTPEGVMVENINNIAMDKIGDIVLEDNGNGLQLIEDYKEDIENIINNHEQ